MGKFSIPAEEVIATYEQLFMILFAIGLVSFTVWVQFQYPFVGLTIAAMGVLLLWLAKMVRKKRDKMIEKENKELAETLEQRAQRAGVKDGEKKAN